MNLVLREVWVITQTPIMDYPAFLRTVQNNPKKQEPYKKLDTLRVYLEEKRKEIQDPIKYLHSLYFEQGLSLHDMLLQVKSIWMDYVDDRWLHYLFTKIFFWKLRENTDLTSYEARKRADWNQMEHLQNYNKAITESISKRFEEVLLSILWEKALQKSEFSIDVYQSFKWKEQKRKKVLYLLACYSWIWIDIIREIHRKHGIWFRGLCRIINSKVQIAKLMFNIDDDSNLVVSPGNLEWYLKSGH